MDVWSRTFDALHDIVTIQDKTLTIIRANKAAHQLFQASDGSLIGKYCYEVFCGGSEPCPDCPLLVTIRNGGAHAVVINNEKLKKVFHVSSSIIPGENGAEDYLVHIARDITRDREAEKILRESEEKYRILLDESPDPIFSFTSEGQYRYANRAFAEGIGKVVEDIIGKRIWDVFPKEEADRRFIFLNQVFQSGVEKVIEARVPRPDGDRYYITTITPVKDTAGKVVSVLCSSKDISERRRMEKKLAEKSDELERYFSLSKDLLCIANTSGEFIRVNQEWERVLGHSIEELNGRNFLDFIHPEDMDATLNALSRLENQQDVLNFENRYRRKDGTYRWIEWRSRPKGNLVYAVARDVTERKRIEEQLRESEDKFRMTFDFSPDAITISRLEDGLYVDINEGFTQKTGFTRDEAIGKTTSELKLWQDPTARQRLVQELREKGFIENLETQFRLKDGTLITGLISARIISLKGVPHLLSVTRDVTEHKKYENEQLKIEKLESLGILAGGIAHDFNNVLTGIMGNISFAKVFLDTDHESYKPLAKAEKAAVRAGELAHQLLTFSRGGKPIKKVVSLRQLVNEAVSLVLHGSNVKKFIDIPRSIHAFEADEGQMSQVFHNIIINASQSMPGGGILTITAQNEVLNDNNTLSLPPGPYIRLIFADQGCGIAVDDLKKIFDPYFTTKSAGTGLGLASAYSIVTRHGGHITAGSVVGKGTTFTIHLPSIGKGWSQYQTSAAEQITGEQRGGSILVMDDEEMIREIAATMLTHLGYEVTTCEGGEKAIELYTASMESGNPFSMVIMDLTIPGGIGGRQAAEHILSLFPDACLVVSSGYSNDPIMSNYRKYGFSGAIAKPYNIHEFKEVLELLLVR
jgi:two-component system, cell cycle sensor histidine kinase and response regulator CckA